MDRIRGKALAGYVVAKRHDGYQVAFTLGELAPDLGNAATSVGTDKDGSLRLLCPNDSAGARSVRMLESIVLYGIH